MIGRPLIRLDSVTSTQDVIFQLAELGAREGTTVLAAYQSGGRGRAGRAWNAAPGDALMFSVLLRPAITPDRLSPLAILVADAIAESLSRLYGLVPAIKWPNDVLLDDRKVAGILIQVRGATAVVGIGMNIRNAGDSLPDGATSVEDVLGLPTGPDELFQDVLTGIGERYAALLQGRGAVFVDSANERLWLRGREVTVDDTGRLVHGVVLDVREDGALLLDTPEGVRAIVSGELTRGPRARKP